MATPLASTGATGQCSYGLGLSLRGPGVGWAGQGRQFEPDLCRTLAAVLCTLSACPCCAEQLAGSWHCVAYLPPHGLLCMPAKNLPVISKLRQKVPPVNKRLLTQEASRRELKSPCKDIESHMCRCAEGTLLPTTGAKSRCISLLSLLLFLGEGFRATSCLFTPRLPPTSQMMSDALASQLW